MKYEELEEKIKMHNPNADMEKIKRAFDFTEAAHQGQLRKSGEPYINHPIAVAYKLADMDMDSTTIVAGLLHDVPEDTKKTLKDIKNEFGDDVALLVDGITKLGQVKYRGMEKYIENLRKMFVAMAADIRVIVIKFADRIHNLETLSFLPPNKQQRIALESLEIYAPIANRLGMGEIKGALEDLSFPYLYPKEYDWIQERIAARRKEKAKSLQLFINDLEEQLKKNNIPYYSIHGRAKHLYSLYHKLLLHNKDITKIYDLVAIRIIVPTIAHCYECLGILHQYCKPLKGRIKDYIAQPKPNGYQSLHTTVFTGTGDIVEIQIRTKEMHYEAEYGIAAHWSYKDKKIDIKDKIHWVSELSKTMREPMEETEEKFLESLKLDVFQNRIYVFTPKGDVLELPEDATPVDFAYRIHTDIGHYCAGAKINDQISALETKLKSGDVVEIFVDKKRSGPAEDWLIFVKTSNAKKHIKTFLRKTEKKQLKRLLDYKGPKN
ncbi:MAG: RelA/SpoT family protein [Patescibacteria group bacterium]|jgi:GTP pyrophosphokinase